MPNLFAYLMLIAWPLVCLAMFRRMSLERAIIWSILGGYLVLPPVASFDLPLVPELDKYTIANLSAFAICVFVLGRKVSLWPATTLPRILFVGFVLGVVPTILTNGDPLSYKVLEVNASLPGVKSLLPGMGLRDLFSVLVNQMIVLLPFFLARQYLSTETGMRELLLALVIGGLAYTIPALIEIRLSPQINIWVYGFFQHSFAQMMRNGGFRPIVFLPHGLWLAMFFVMALLATAALARTFTGDKRTRYLLAMLYLAFVLVLSKSLASLAYGIALTPVVLLASAKTQIRLAILFATIAVIYPMLRNLGLVPMQTMLDYAQAISPDRAHSLGFRFDNENLLLARAQEKPWFGWGGWGRNLVRDLETGKVLTIPDGRWIIVFGTFGWVGYIAEMGLLASPLLLLGRSMHKLRESSISPYVAAISLILAITMIDMLLNATLIPITWMCAGAVLGYVERVRIETRVIRKTALFGDGPEIGRPVQKGKGRTAI